MCDEPRPGFITRQMIDANGRRLNRRDARQACKCQHNQAPAETPTQYAQKILITVGGIVLLASAGTILHALLIAVVCIGVGVPAGAAAYVVYRMRRRRRYVVAELPPPAARAAVTGVRVRELAPRRVGRPAIGTRASARRER